jgi:AraC-like DNA-binding protein
MRVALDRLAACDLTHELRTEDLSGPLNLSTSRLRHLFQQQVGFSPAQIFKLRRLHTAKELLVSTFMRVKEVMTAVGLHDASHFVHDFKRIYGQTPSQLRRQADARKAGEMGTHQKASTHKASAA